MGDSIRQALAARYVAQEARKAAEAGKKPAPSLDDYSFIALCTRSGLPAPVAQHRFHPLRQWRFDFAWVPQLLALEVEGGIWRRGGGAHSHPLNIERDLEKYSEGAILGWRILRVAPEHLTRRGLDYVARALANTEGPDAGPGNTR